MQPWVLLLLLLPLLAWADTSDQAAGPCPPPDQAPPTLDEATLLSWLHCDPTPLAEPELFQQRLLSSDSHTWSDQPLWLALAKPLQPGSLHAVVARHWQQQGLPITPVRQADHTLFHLALRQLDSQWMHWLLSQTPGPLAPDVSQAWLAAALDPPINGDALRMGLQRLAQPVDDAWLLQAVSQQHPDLLTAIAPLTEHLPLDTLNREALQTLFEVALAQQLSPAFLDRLLAQGATLPAAEDQAWYLWHAAQQERPDLLQWWLAQGAALDHPDGDGYVPLYFASVPATRLLLEAGANPNAAGAAGNPMFNQGPVAARYHGGESLSAAKARLLLDAGYRVGQTNRHNHTALAQAVRHGNLALVQLLVESGENPWQGPANEKPLLWDALKQGRLPLVLAITRTRDHYVGKEQGLLLAYVKEPDARPELVEALIVAGLPLELTDEMGDTALTLSGRHRAWHLSEVLLRYGANPHHVNQLGCGLQCYAWDMPPGLQHQLTPAQQGFVWPDINIATPAFFALSFAPALLLWLAHTGWQLARRRRILPSFWMMLGNLVPWWLIGSVMYFHCEPCVIPDTAGQSQSLMMLSALTLALTYYRGELRHSAARLTEPPTSPDTQSP